MRCRIPERKGLKKVSKVLKLLRAGLTIITELEARDVRILNVEY